MQMQYELSLLFVNLEAISKLGEGVLTDSLSFRGWNNAYYGERYFRRMIIMIKQIIDWSNAEYEEALNNSDLTLHERYKKAFVSGAVEGAIDGLVLSGVALISVGFIKMIVDASKK